MRVALLTNLLTPYRLPVYCDLAATPGWRLRVLLCAAIESTRRQALAGAHEAGRAALDVEIVSGASLRRRVRTHRGQASKHGSMLHVPWGVLGALRRFAPDVVVTSELGPRTAFASAYAALHRVPLVIWCYHSRASAASVGPLERAWRRWLLARAHAVVGMGIQARAVLRGLGVPPTRLFDAPNAHAAEWWEERFRALDPIAERLALRAGVRARERVALVAGRLEEVKGILPLLAAWRALPGPARAGWTLLFVGDGPLIEAVARAQREAAEGEIAHLPAQPPETLAGIYVAADLMVFPSLGDTWGLVVNEAMACGLPVLCSRHAGCADDLITNGETGWLFDPTDAEGFRDALAHALADPGRERIAARARGAAKRFGPATQAQGLRRAILHACVPR